MDGKTGLERVNGKGLERRTGIGKRIGKEVGTIGNEDKKGKGIREKDRNWDWKDGREEGLKRRKEKE
jgi:hypothetical protein